MKNARMAAFYIGVAAIFAAIALILWVIFHPCDGNNSDCLGGAGVLLVFAFLALVFGIVLLLTAIFTPRGDWGSPVETCEYGDKPR